MKNRLLAVLLSFAVVFNLASAVNAGAAGNDGVKLYYEKLYAADGAYITDLEGAVDKEALHAYLRKELAKCISPVDVSSFNIPSSLSTQLFTYIWKEMPECFQVKGLGSTSVNDKLTSLTVTYRDFCTSESEYESMMDECDAAASELLYDVEDNDSLSDLDKALLIHDRLALRCEYDYGYVLPSYTMYGAFASKTAVCEGYTKAYMYLLRRAGIDCRYCVSDALNHSWNIVTIDGVEYHVDVTWDDVSWYKGGRGCVGRVGHTNFLRSTAGIRESHNAYDFDTAPTDTRYDSASWQDSQAAFLLLDGKIYCIDGKNEKLMRYYPDAAVLCDVSDSWTADGNSYWDGNYSRLATDGESLFYSGASKIYRYDIASGETETADEPPLSEHVSIYGLVYDGGYFVCDVNKTPPYGGDYSGLEQLRRFYTPVAGHAPAAAVKENAKAPTCTEAGSFEQVVYCSVCFKELARETKADPATGHDWDEWDIVSSATCERTGTQTRVCKNDPEHFETRDIQPTGHDWGEWVYNNDATYESDGTKTRVCKSNARHTETVAAEGTKLTPKAVFSDVASGAYYEIAVSWAVDLNVTAGTGKTTFSPNNKCTRGQVVTFLWRAAGSPEPKTKTNPFTDVKETGFYYKAVLWAVENEVTSGLSATAFGPGRECTRGQVVTFLWRAKGSPAPKKTEHPFNDVSANGFYFKAMLWAVENGVTAGTGKATFAPDNTCTRGQVVTFLYRSFK